LKKIAKRDIREEGENPLTRMVPEAVLVIVSCGGLVVSERKRRNLRQWGVWNINGGIIMDQTDHTVSMRLVY